MAQSRQGIGNKMLGSMRPEDFALTADELERVELPEHFEIASPGGKLRYGYFPESGIGSVLSVSHTGKLSEAGMFGVEESVPSSTIIGDDQVPYRIEMRYGVPRSACR